MQIAIGEHARRRIAVEAHDGVVELGDDVERPSVRTERQSRRVVEPRADAVRGGAGQERAGVRTHGTQVGRPADAASIREVTGRRIAIEVRDARDVDRVQGRAIGADRHRPDGVEPRGDARGGSAGDQRAGVRARGARLGRPADAALIREGARRRIAIETCDGVVAGGRRVERLPVRARRQREDMVEAGLLAVESRRADLGAGMHHRELAGDASLVEERAGRRIAVEACDPVVGARGHVEGLLVRAEHHRAKVVEAGVGAGRRRSVDGGAGVRPPRSGLGVASDALLVGEAPDHWTRDRSPGSADAVCTRITERAPVTVLTGRRVVRVLTRSHAVADVVGAWRRVGAAGRACREAFAAAALEGADVADRHSVAVAVHRARDAALIGRRAESGVAGVDRAAGQPHGDGRGGTPVVGEGTERRGDVRKIAGPREPASASWERL